MFKPSSQEVMGSHLDKYLIPKLGDVPVAAIDDRLTQELITHLEWGRSTSGRTG